jgi:DNA topoisomerase IA
MRHAPQDRIVRREIAQGVVNAAQDFEGPLAVRVEDKRQGPPKLHDLPSLQKLCGSRFGWPPSKTLAVAQELYDRQGKKIITYPRAEVRYLPQSLISDVPRPATTRQDGMPRLELILLRAAVVGDNIEIHGQRIRLHGINPPSDRRPPAKDRKRDELAF